MNTRLKAPRSSGRISSAAFSSERVGWLARSVVTRSVSLVALGVANPGSRTSPRATSDSAASRASSPVLIRLPLCPSATPPSPVCRKVGWAFSQLLEPVVE